MRLRRARGRVAVESRAYLMCISGTSPAHLGRISGASRLEGERELIITHVEVRVDAAAGNVRDREGVGGSHLGVG